MLRKHSTPLSQASIRYELASQGLSYQSVYISACLAALEGVGKIHRLARGLYGLPVTTITLKPDIYAMVTAKGDGLASIYPATNVAEENAQKIAKAGGSKGVRMRAIALAGGSQLERLIVQMFNERGAWSYQDIVTRCMKAGFTPGLVSTQLWALKLRKLIKNPGRGIWTR